MPKHQRKYKTIDNLKVCHDLEVMGNTELEGDVRVGGDVTIKKDLTVKEDLTVKGTTTFKGSITPVSGTFSPGTDRFPTIQSIFDFLEGKAVDNVLIDLLAPPSGVKVYNELVFAKNILSVASQGFAMPQSQYPYDNFSRLTAVIPGLSIRGDPRYASGATYIDGAQFNVFSIKRPGSGNGYFSNLGTPYGYVDLIRPAPGQIQAVITSAPAFNPDTRAGGQEISQPDFVAAGVLPNDQIRIRDDTGVFADFVITAVSGNILSYNGDVTALGPRSELILLPRVQITSTNAPASFGLVNFSNMGATVQGVWLKNQAQGDALEVWNNAFVKIQQSVVDVLGNNAAGISVAFGGTIGTESSGINMHNTVIGGFAGLLMTDCGRVDDGDWVFTDSVFNVFDFEATSIGHFNSVNTVGGVINWFQQLSTRTSIVTLFGSYGSAVISLLLNDASSLGLQVDNLQIDSGGSQFGVILNDAGVLAVSGGDGNSGAPYSSKVVNCGVAFTLDAQAIVALENAAPFLIDNVGVGVVAVAGGKVGISNEITYGPGVGINRAMQVGAQYIAANSTETPNNVLTYTASGTLDSTIPVQVIDQPAGVTLSFDPSSIQSDSNIAVYQGKTYLLTSINASPNMNQLVLLGGAKFIGVGTSAGGDTTVSFGSAVSAGSFIRFTVLSATLVQIEALFNGSVSVAESIPAQKSSIKRYSVPKVDLTRIPNRYEKLVKNILKQYIR